jgi:hypothetical protein
MSASFLLIPGFIFRLFLLSLILQPALLYAVEVDATNKSLKQMKQVTLDRAESLALSKHETWLALLHYKRETLSRDLISQADDAVFFLHSDGKHDAKAELVASINAFFSEPQSGHAQCLFPARWWWLKQQLKLSNNYDVRCPQLEAFMRRVAHDKLVLIFPTMYLNNPGSTFGHTFLRFDSDDESTLLSQTLNYAARTDKTDNILNYVRKGIFGGYTGFFRMRSYFKTVQEYNNIENRDIWEYELAFNKMEIEQLVRHAWEIKDIDFDYYFFKENCSYRLLAMLDVVRTGMQLTAEGKFPAYAIPVDTVRALDDIGLITSRKLRASLVTRIDHYFSKDEKNTETILTIAMDETIVESEEILKHVNNIKRDTDKVNVLQQSYNILQFNGEASSAKAKNILELANRFGNKLKVNAKEVIKTNYDQISPEKGHDSVRVSVGYGKQNTHEYIDFRFRPAFHDLMDPMRGYVSGAAINSFEARFKWFSDSDNGRSENSSRAGKLSLESLSVLNITSLNPTRRWNQALSWLLDFRFDRTQLSEADSVRNFISRGGAGLSLQKKHFFPFLMLLGEWNLSSKYEKGHSLLLGLQAGLQLNFNLNRLMLRYQKDKAVSGFNLDRVVSELQWQYDFQVNHAMRLRYKRIEYDFFADKDWSLSYNYYF